jgi:hypothetical protein
MIVLLTASGGLASPKPLPVRAPNVQVDKANPISGDWNATFEVEGMKVPFRFKLRLEGNKVTGTAESEHAGAGTLTDGSYSDEKLSFTMVFAKHESIAVSGKLEGSSGECLHDMAHDARQSPVQAPELTQPSYHSVALYRIFRC